MRITRVFFDINMGYGFQGLTQIAKENKTKLEADTTVLFMNKKMTAFKVVVNGQYLVYFKNGSRRIPLEAIQYLPQQFGGSQMEVDGAIRKSLLHKLE